MAKKIFLTDILSSISTYVWDSFLPKVKLKMILNILVDMFKKVKQCKKDKFYLSFVSYLFTFYEIIQPSLKLCFPKDNEQNINI